MEVWDFPHSANDRVGPNPIVDPDPLPYPHSLVGVHSFLFKSKRQRLSPLFKLNRTPHAPVPKFALYPKLVRDPDTKRKCLLDNRLIDTQVWPADDGAPALTSVIRHKPR